VPIWRCATNLLHQCRCLRISWSSTRLAPATLPTGASAQGSDGFLKGLVVIDDVAYFGMAPPMERQGRDAVTVSCSLVAVDLVRRRHLFTHAVATRGLLNLVSAPHLSLASTFVAQYSGGAAHHASLRAPDDASAGGQRVPGDADGAQAEGLAGMAEAAGLEGQWSEAWLEHALAQADVAGAAPAGRAIRNR
jgi:hypothetical protein